MRPLKPSVILTILMSLVLFEPAKSQRLSFNVQGTEQVLITNETGIIDFNEVTISGLTFFKPGDEGVIIDLNQNQDHIAIFRIEAPNHLDINTDVSATSFSLLCTSNCPEPLPTLEFQLGWSYWNNSVNNDVTTTPLISELLPLAREVLSPTGIPLNFGSATFPMRKRTLASLAPSAPPVPDHDGYVNVPATSAFILVYGRLGSIPGNIHSGDYEATISINVSTSNIP